MRSTTRTGGSGSPKTWAVNSRPRGETTFSWSASWRRSWANCSAAPASAVRMRRRVRLAMTVLEFLPGRAGAGSERGGSGGGNAVRSRPWRWAGPPVRGRPSATVALYGRGGAVARNGRLQSPAQQLVEVIAPGLALHAEPARVIRAAVQPPLHVLADGHVL